MNKKINRIEGFLIGLILIPVLMCVCVVVFFLVLTLPILCAIRPDVIKFT